MPARILVLLTDGDLRYPERMKLSWLLPGALLFTVAGFILIGLTGLDDPNRGLAADEQPAERIDSKREDDGGDPAR